MNGPPTAIFVANRSYGIASARLPLVERFVGGGWRVVVAGARDVSVEQFNTIGAEFIEIPFRRGGVALSDFTAFRSLKRLYGELRPTVIFHYNTKPIVLGGAAARALQGVTIFNIVTGMGYGIYGGGVLARVLHSAYRNVLPIAECTIFENSDDLAYFLKNKLVEADKAQVIVSSGVVTANFQIPRRSEGDRVKVALVGRLVWQKGIAEFGEAAERMRASSTKLRMCLAGEFDPEHPDAVPEEWVRSRVAGGILEFEGYVRDMPNFLAGVDVLVVPSTFGEGVPRVVLEASASGIPVVASDVPGTREVVVHGETGYLVPPGDAGALAARIEQLVMEPELRTRMGEAGRRLVIERYDRTVILERYASIYRARRIDPDRAPRF